MYLTIQRQALGMATRRRPKSSADMQSDYKLLQALHHNVIFAECRFQMPSDTLLFRGNLRCRKVDMEMNHRRSS